MKILTIFSILLLSVAAFAGPEERKEAQTCYRLNKLAQGGVMKAHLPQEICLESLAIDPRSKDVTVESYFSRSVFQDIRIRNFKVNKAAGYDFEVSREFFEIREECCGNQDLLRLAIFGRTDARGVADVRKLQVAIVHEETHDYGHSGTDYETYEYSIR